MVEDTIRGAFIALSLERNQIDETISTLERASRAASGKEGTAPGRSAGEGLGEDLPLRE